MSQEVRPIILLAGDEAARALCRAGLAGLAADVVEAPAGDVLKARRAHNPHVVVVASSAGAESAVELAAGLQAQTGVNPAPAVVLVPPGTPADLVRRAYAAGASDCLALSTETGEILRHKIGLFLRLERERGDLHNELERLEREKREWQASGLVLRESEIRLGNMATHDPLTGLPNRLLFQDRFDGALRRAARHRRRVAVALVGLTGLKVLTDRSGFAAADELVAVCAGRLLRAVRASDTAARVGEHEFALLLEGLPDLEVVSMLGRKVAEALWQPSTLHATLDGVPVEWQPRGEIGIAVYPDHATAGDRLLMAAMSARYEARGRDQHLAIGGPGPFPPLTPGRH